MNTIHHRSQFRFPLWLVVLIGLAMAPSAFAAAPVLFGTCGTAPTGKTCLQDCYASRNFADAGWATNCAVTWCNDSANFTNTSYKTQCCPDANGTTYSNCSATPPSSGSTLNLAKAPLFLSQVVDPNVFFEIDDSGSMDFEVLMGPYYRACNYDIKHPGYGACKNSLITDGNLYVRSKDFTGERQYYNVFNSDNWASAYYPSIEDEEDGGKAVVKYEWRALSSALNATYFNPTVTYGPWYRYETLAGVTAPYKATFTKLKSQPMPGMTGYTNLRDMSGNSYLGKSYSSLSDNKFFEFHVWLDSDSWCGKTTTGGADYPEVGSNSESCVPSKGRYHNRRGVPNGIVDYWDDHVRYRVDVVSGVNTVTADYISYTTADDGTLTENVVKSWTFTGSTKDPVAIDYLDANGKKGTDGVIDYSGTGQTADQLVQNIANWYEFDRNRTYVARQVVGEVISQNPNMRYGLGLIKKVPTQTVSGVTSVRTYTNGTKTGLQTFTYMPSATKGPYSYDTLLTNMYWHHLDEIPSGTSSRYGTPLRTGYMDMEKYFDYATNTANNPITESCQQNFAIVMTDGYYNGGESPGVGDADGDGTKEKMSDLAYKYGVNSGYDLSSLLANKVPVRNNAGLTELKPQHLVTFPVGFGVRGKLVDGVQWRKDATTGEILPVTLAKDGWPDANFSTQADFSPVIDPAKKGETAVITSKDWLAADISESASTDVPEKVDDLWHAAYNGNGKFISARNPQELIQGFQEIFNTIASIVSSSTALASTSGRVQGDALLYLAQFNSGDWTGNLQARKTLSTGGVLATPAWETTNTMSGINYNTRVVITYNPKFHYGIPFRFPADYTKPNPSTPAPGVDTEMDVVEINKLLSAAPYASNTAVSTEIAANQAYGTALVNYIRGDRSQEGTGTTYQFRKRAKLLGDIISSAPEYVGRPDEPFPNTIAAGAYSSFAKKYENRTPMVYVGANDGMLHGFNSLEDTAAGGGQELLAYVPPMTYKNLPAYASPSYSHLFYVNGPTNSMDVYDSTFPTADYGWQTILVGALGQGGQGLYALNVTDPANFSEANAKKMVMWAYTHENDADLGYVYGKIPVVKLNNGRWGALVGNGYNSNEADGSAGVGTAALFIIDAVTGQLIRKIDTGDIGTATMANGLASPAAVDFDGNWTADYVYAGDLMGNLWRFDISDSTLSKWKVDKLFKTDTGQPITVQPKVAKHPNGGYMILFGTGKYLEVGDNVVTSTTPTQAFYGIWDDLSSNAVKTITSADLFEQTIDQQATAVVGGYTYGIRITSKAEPTYTGNKVHKGWFIQLTTANTTTPSTPNPNEGERAVTDPQLASDASRVVFTTWVPTQDPCSAGGYSWLMELDSISGSRLADPPFDLNKDGSFNISDLDYDTLSKIADGTIPSGVMMDGLVQSPEIVKGNSTGSGGCVSEGKYMSDTTGGIQSIQESAECAVGRISWRYLN